MPRKLVIPPDPNFSLQLVLDAAQGKKIPYTSARLWLGGADPVGDLERRGIDFNAREVQVRKRNKMPIDPFAFQYPLIYNGHPGGRGRGGEWGG